MLNFRLVVTTLRRLLIPKQQSVEEPESEGVYARVTYYKEASYCSTPIQYPNIFESRNQEIRGIFMQQLKNTPFHERTSALCQPQNWRKWAGYYVVGSYEHTIDREYWAIRNAAALIDVTPLMKYIVKGKDAAALLHKVTTRNIQKMKVGQLYYTGWCDDEGKMIDDGTVARLDESTFRLTAAEPNLRWLMLNAVGLDVQFEDQTDSVASLSLQGPNSRVILNRHLRIQSRWAEIFPLDEEQAWRS